ncbi:hypothetical protein FOZ60_013582 [Perkinsus olseni]|nr:hypothetical protein FOZ60_013582 [Perkinsus olseni]
MKGSSTSTLLRHMDGCEGKKNPHQATISSYFQSKSLNKAQREQLTNSLVEAVAALPGLGFISPSKSEFLALIQTVSDLTARAGAPIDAAREVVSDVTLRNKMIEKARSREELVRSLLSKQGTCKQVLLDGWRNPYTHGEVLGVTVVVIKDAQPYAVAIAPRDLPSGKSKDLGEALAEVCDNFNIKMIDGLFTSDSCNANLSALRNLPSIPCYCHLVQLAVDEGVIPSKTEMAETAGYREVALPSLLAAQPRPGGSSTKTLLNECSRLVAFFKRSQLNKALTELREIPGLIKLKQRNITRWDSSLLMISSILASWDGVTLLLARRGQTRHFETVLSQKQMLMDLSSLLSPFRAATKDMERVQRGVAAIGIRRLEECWVHLNTTPANESEAVTETRRAMRKAFVNKVIMRLTPDALLGAMMEPRYKLAGVERLGIVREFRKKDDLLDRENLVGELKVWTINENVHECVAADEGEDEATVALDDSRISPGTLPEVGKPA